MKKYFILSGVFLLFACNSANEKTILLESESGNDSLNVVNGKLEEQLQNKEAVIDGFLRSFNEIQDNINIIKAKEKSLTFSNDGSDVRKLPQEQILNDVKFINELLDKNRTALAALREKLKSSDLKIGELERTIANLTTQLNQNEEEISFLKSKLITLNSKLVNIDAAYNKEKQESARKTEKLNTAYCTIGTAGELEKKGVITKKGGFLGIGKLKELNPNLTTGMFSAIDIYQTKEISIAARSVKVITEHTKGSFIIGEKYGVKTLVILSPDEFWKTSRYLIIQVSADEPEEHKR